MREEIIGDCRLILGDAREIVPTIQYADVMVTDPPYGIDGGSGGDARAFQKGRYSGAFEDTAEYIASMCVPVIAWAAENLFAVAVTPGNRCLHLYPASRDIGCFWTPAASVHGPWGMTTFHPILYYGKDWRAGRGALPSGRQVTESAEKNGHPCPKPIKAWEWLVDKVAPPGATVLDPFMGSGTTLVASAKLGRRAIGIEIDPSYFDIACRRVEQAYHQPDLFIAPPPKPEQIAMAL